MKKLKRITIRLSESTLLNLDRLAERFGKSRSAVIVDLIDNSIQSTDRVRVESVEDHIESGKRLDLKKILMEHGLMDEEKPKFKEVMHGKSS